MKKQSIFSGIVWDRRCDGSYEVTDTYTRKVFIVWKNVNGKFCFHAPNAAYMSKIEITKQIIATRTA